MLGPMLTGTACSQGSLELAVDSLNHTIGRGIVRGHADMVSADDKHKLGEEVAFKLVTSVSCDDRGAAKL